MSDEEFQRRQAEDVALASANARVHACDLKLAALRGKVEASIDSLERDPELRELVRAETWLRWQQNPENRHPKADRVRWSKRLKAYERVPAGWPKGTGIERELQRVLGPIREKMLSRLDAGEPLASGQPEAVSESVAALRAAIGGT